MSTSSPNLTEFQLGVFVRLVLGYPSWRIAAELAETEDVVRSVAASPEVRLALAEARQTIVANAATIQERFSALATDAVDVLENLMHGARNETVRHQCARDILNYAGHKPPERIQATVDSSHQVFNVHALGEDEREFIRAVAEKAAKSLFHRTAALPPGTKP